MHPNNARCALWSQIDFADSPLDDENSPPAHGIFSQSVKNMLINYREHLPFKSDFIFARARNLKRESGENSVRKMLKNFALNITPHGFCRTFLAIAHKR